MSDQPYSPGAYPSMPDEPAAGRPVGRAPAPVANAVKLMFLRAALSLLGLLVLFSTRDGLQDQLRRSDPDADTATLESAVAVALVVGTVFGLVLTALYLLLALQVRRGRSWARTVAVVLAGLSALAGVVSLVQATSGAGRVLGLLTLVVDVAVVVLLLSRASSGYFRRPA